MGRVKPIDEPLLFQLCELHLSVRSIAKILRVSEDTLHRKYAAKIASVKEKSKARILSILYSKAIDEKDLKAIEMILKRFPELYQEHLTITIQDNAFSTLSEDEKAKVLTMALESKTQRNAIEE